MSEGYVYKYINEVTGMWYLGSTNGKYKNYSGSGRVWRQVIKNQDIDNFTKEILYTGPYYREVEETLLKELDAMNDPYSYNQINSTTFDVTGYKHTEVTKKKMSESGRGRKPSEKTRLLLSEQKRGSGNPAFGKPGTRLGAKLTEEHKLILKTKLTGYKHELRTCNYCGVTGGGPNMTRFHFSKCRKATL